MAARPLFLVLFLFLLGDSFSQRLSFLRLPPAVLRAFDDDHGVVVVAPLPVDQIEPLVANLVGLPSDLRWSGLTTFSGLDRPKANLLFVVDGVESSSAALDFGDAVVELDVDSADDDDIIEAGFRGLGQRIQSTFKDSPLLLTNAADPIDARAGVNAAFEASSNAVDRVAGAMKMNRVFKLERLDVAESPVVDFLSELSDVQFLVESLSSSALKSLVADSTPDAFLFRFRGLKGVSAAYGVDSPQMNEAESILKKFIEKTTADVEKVYDGKVAVEVATLPSRIGAASSSRRHRRAAAADAGGTNGTNPHNISPTYNWEYAATFNMQIWTGVLLVVVVYLVSFAMWNMDPGRDGYVYRMTMPKNRNS